MKQYLKGRDLSNKKLAQKKTRNVFVQFLPQFALINSANISTWLNTQINSVKINYLQTFSQIFLQIYLPLNRFTHII